MTAMNMKFSRGSLIRTMSSISDVSGAPSDGDSDNLEPSQGFHSAPASIDFLFSPCPDHVPAGEDDELEPTQIRRLSSARFVAESNDPNDERVSPMRAPKRTISQKVIKSFTKSARSLLSPTKKMSKEDKKLNTSTKSAPTMPMRKASFLG
mmetsp:Transcript_23061/g.56870  ORF Transcript_23061/g.56870 Transcript_23061/m.56870 type:complete len:151 (+) Transcript_23061:134-586(+)